MWLTLGMLAWAGGDGRPDAFRQLDEILPAPNDVRTVTGRPGSAYWQQQVDYDIEVTIDEATAILTGSETITYTNNSPDTLDYLWVHLEPDLLKPTAQGALMATAPNMDDMSYRGFANLLGRTTFDANLQLSRVEDDRGKMEFASAVSFALAALVVNLSACHLKKQLNIEFSIELN